MQNEKSSVYDIITERIIAILERGEIPWSKPWSGAANIPPTNFKSRKAYRGANIWLLSCVPYSCPYWLSYKQAQEMGGTVKKGEKGYPVIFWTFLDKRDAQGKVIIDANGKPAKQPLLRYYTVFNLEQCDGIKWEKPESNGATFNPIETAESIVQAFVGAPEIRHGADAAYYVPAFDRVFMPNKEAFVGVQEYYSTLFHELIHSTGHSKRLNRKGVSESLEANHNFGSADYSKEELVAEMGAAYLCGQAGILNRTIANSAAYVQNWIKVLKGDSKLIVTAAAQAQKAADHILGTKFETDSE